jgi:hypothetical protein
MRLWICLEEGYESVAGMMHDATNAFLTAFFAVVVVMLENHYRLCLTLAGMIQAAGVKIAVVASKAAHGTNTLLLC